MDFARQMQRDCPDLEVVTDPGVLESHGQDWSHFRTPAPAAVVFPRSVEQVRELVRAAARHRIPLVPSGGRTGLSGGAVACSGEVVVSFDRMRRILDFNAVERTVTVEAGVVTAQLQAFARDKGLYYPVSFASEGSSQVGGNIATNAGGIRVIRYGMTRDRVAGLKVVTGTGEVLDCNRGLVKNASGYDFRHLFIGSEGTLGFVVEATMKLTDPPAPSRVMLLALDKLAGVMPLFDLLQSFLGLSAFELFNDRSMHHVRLAHGLPDPLGQAAPWYVVTEFDCPGESTERIALECFERAVESGWLRDGVISQNEKQAADLWRYREGIAESVAHYPPYKNDVSVTVSRVPEFLLRLAELLDEVCPEYDVLYYGHVGDGNIHLNILRPEGVSLEDFEARSNVISRRSYELTREMGGSASAEHGIGLLKAHWLSTTRSAAEIEMMRGIKQLFDPAGILNPGKLLSK